MIIRIVKMTFQEEKVPEFLEIFMASRQLIRDMPGCSHLELLREKPEGNVFFTYSCWETENDLNNYRSSATFGNVWSRTKLLFAHPPEAWTTGRIAQL